MSSAPEPPSPPRSSARNMHNKELSRRSSAAFVDVPALCWRLIDPAEPWVLTENGSFLGHFDWVPKQFRVGPWSMAAQCYLTALFYVSAMVFAYYGSDISRPWWNTATTTAKSHIDTHNDSFHQMEAYPPVYSLKWCYNVAASVWMLYIMVLVLRGALGIRAWSTYTIQSWTALWTRHVLCTLAPFAPWARDWAEYTRFPVACSTTCTFVLWNFVIAPYAYCVALKTREQKQNFWDFCTSFRLVQIHIFNIVFCILNILWSSPRRDLAHVDLALAVVSAVVYMAWYLLVLDRLGIHLYPVFSPRVWWVVIPMWTVLLLTYLVTFYAWRFALSPSSSPQG